MSKRLVLSALAVFVGIPMLAAETAPLGLLLVGIAVALLALPRLGRRRGAI